MLEIIWDSAILRFIVVFIILFNIVKNIRVFRLMNYDSAKKKMDNVKNEYSNKSSYIIILAGLMNIIYSMTGYIIGLFFIAKFTFMPLPFFISFNFLFLIFLFKLCKVMWNGLCTDGILEYNVNTYINNILVNMFEFIILIFMGSVIMYQTIKFLCC